MKKRLLSWLMVLTLCLTLLPTAALADTGAGESSGSETHEHYLCGTNHTCANTQDSEREFTEWTDALAQKRYGAGSTAANSLPVDGPASYYLTQDVELTETWEPNAYITLCLNGHSITMKGDRSVISSSGTFTLVDCKGDSHDDKYGKITHASGYKGHGVELTGGTFTMYGGNITGNNDSGVSMTGSSTFNMYGGQITKNTAHSGGGVYSDHGSNSKCTFNMYDGEISDNTATMYGGGVYNGDTSTFNMRGGEITDNSYSNDQGNSSGGGVRVSGTMTVSGNVKITGNTKGTGSGSATNNVYLVGDDAVITIDGALIGGAGSIGVSKSTKSLTAGQSVKIAEGKNYALQEDDLKAFSSDAGDPYQIQKSGNELLLVNTTNVPHKHFLCTTDNTCTKVGGHDCGSNKTTFIKWTDELAQRQNGEGKTAANSLPNTAGNYYLTANVELDSYWKPKSGTVLCLNGYSITLDKDTKQDHGVIYVTGGFTLADCKGEQGEYGKITHGKDADGTPYDDCGVTVRSGNFTMYGGNITGNETRSWAYGCGVYVGHWNNNPAGTFTMYGGKISGNKAQSFGGGVYAADNFTMYGGEISDNEAGDGGGVYVSSGGTFTMNGGTISNNEATYSGSGRHGAGGGGVFIEYAGRFTMEKGLISKNKYTGTGSYPGGGGVYVQQMLNYEHSTDPAFTMKGGTISDNETNYAGGGVYVGEYNRFTMEGGTISNNKAFATSNNGRGEGGGVYAYGSFTMRGGEISGNNCDGSNYSGYLSGDGCLGGGVYVATDDDAAMTVSGNVKITGNTKSPKGGNSEKDNVYLPGKTITIGGALTGEAGSIGVTTSTEPKEKRPVTIAAAGSNYTITKPDKDRFASDKEGFKVECKDDKLVLAMQTAATEEHKHDLCGTTHTPAGEHQTEREVTFATELKMENGKLMKGGSEWTKSTVNRADGGREQTGYVLSQGEYYLYGDITLSDAAILINGDVKLCLNGHTIDRANETGGLDYVIWVLGKDNAHLTLTDCKGTGKLTGGKNGGVDVFGFCTLDMYGGSITENKSTGVSIGQFGRFNMYGGSITKNSANYGGGVYNGGTVNMYGGEISGNTASNKGGGVYMAESMGNYQGGILNVSGAAKITDNTVNGVANNVYLPSGKTITLGRFTEITPIGVTTADEPTPSSNVIIAKNVGELDYTNIIKSDSSKYVTKQIEGNLVLGEKGSNPQPGKVDAGVNITAENANDPAPTNVIYGDTFKLGTTLQSTGNTQTSSWTWTSSNDNVLAVTGSGSAATVKALKPGEATITVTYESEGAEGSATATIKVKQRTLTVKPKDITITVGDELPDFTVEYTGFAEGDTKESVIESDPSTIGLNKADGTPVGTDEARNTVGTYTMDFRGHSVGFKAGMDEKYTPEYKSGTLTVNAASTPSTPSTPSPPSSGSSSGSSTITKTETTTNPDGSVTKTETKSDGTVIETTTNPDGSTSKTESKTTTKSNGSTVETVTETNTGADGSKSTSKTETTTAKDGSKTETKSETKTEADGTKSETKSETKTDANGVTSGTETTKTTAPNGSTGTTTTTTENGNTKTEAEAKVSEKAIEDAKKSGEAVKVPTEVKAGENSNSAPTVKVELPKNAGKTKIEIPVSDVNSGTVAVIVHPDGTEEIVKDSKPTADGVELTVDGSATVKVIDNSKDFIDTRNHWSRDEVNFVASREIFNGVGGNLFGVGQPMTRGMVNTVLARLAGIDTTPSAGQKWYEVGTEWAKSQGITDGTNPEASVTREQLATLLYRFCGTPKVSGVLSFADAGEVSDYAQSALLWATQNDILNGVGNNRVAPNADAQRAQVAAMMARYLKNVG